MAPKFDKNVFSNFKNFSVKTADELEIGKTYYTNSYPEKFVLRGLINDTMLEVSRASRNEKGNEYVASALNGVRMENPTWFITDKFKLHSLHDLNVGASYNPWLIFGDKDMADACKKHMKITYDDDSYLNNAWPYNDICVIYKDISSFALLKSRNLS